MDPAPEMYSQDALTTPTPVQSGTSPRITQQDVARAAGVHNSTVSLALRGSQSISAETRERVRQLAASMGYTPDPAVQALVAYRIRLSVPRTSAAIAFVTNGPSEYGWRTHPASEWGFLGARDRAAELGYQLNHFWAGESGLNQRRLSQVLFHRGIAGVLFSGSHTAQNWTGLSWNSLCAVSLGFGEVTPSINRIMSDPAGHIRLALRRVHASGYRRIAVIVPQVLSSEVDGAWEQAVAAEQRRSVDGVHISLFILRGAPLCETPRADACTRETLRLSQWLALHEPEVVVGWMSWMRPYMRQMQLEVPRDFAFVEMDCDENADDFSGVLQNHRAVGVIAVDMVVHQLQQNVRGVPQIPTRTLVEGVWCEGASMPQRGGRSVQCVPTASGSIESRETAMDARPGVVMADA